MKSLTLRPGRPCRGECTRRTRALGLVLAMAWAGLTPQLASAGRPLFTEDAAVLGVHQCEFESFAARQSGSDATGLSAQVGCGLGARTQLALATASETRWASAQGALTGKTALIAQGSDSVALSIAYALVWQTGPHEPLRHQSTEVKAVLSVPLADLLLHANAGWAGAHAEHTDRLTWNAALEKIDAFERVDLMIELAGDNRAAPCMQVGARWAILPARLYVDGALGMRANARKDRQASLGMRLAF